MESITKTTAQLEKTTTPIPTPPGWKTPGDILRISEDGSGIVFIEAAITHDMKTAKNGEKTTTRIPEIDEIEFTTKPEISDSKITEVPPKGWFAQTVSDDVTSVSNGSGLEDLS